MAATSGVATLEQTGAVAPVRLPGTTYTNRANPVRNFFEGGGGGGWLGVGRRSQGWNPEGSVFNDYRQPSRVLLPPK